jgi:hypothetical protein
MSIDSGMPKELPDVFARRARLSSKAIVTAIVLTLAALAAIAIATGRGTQTSVKELGPVTKIPADTRSAAALVPVIDR